MTLDVVVSRVEFGPRCRALGPFRTPSELGRALKPRRRRRPRLVVPRPGQRIDDATCTQYKRTGLQNAEAQGLVTREFTYDRRRDVVRTVWKRARVRTAVGPMWPPGRRT